MITSENARELQRKGVEARRLYRLQRESERLGPVIPDALQELTQDPLGMELSRVQWQLVQKMKDNDDAKAVSALAQALKNVRETYHLVTGQAKPGVLRETGRSKDRKAYSPPAPAAPQPVVDTTQNQGTINGSDS